eukprot:53219-Chlamydomonas_euryale.AAC.1
MCTEGADGYCAPPDSTRLALGCLVLLTGWTRGMLCSPTSQPDYPAFCLAFTVALFSALSGSQRSVTFLWVVTRLLLTILWSSFQDRHVPILFRQSAVDGRLWPPRLRAWPI